MSVGEKDDYAVGGEDKPLESQIKFVEVNLLTGFSSLSPKNHNQYSASVLYPGEKQEVAVYLHNKI